LCRRRDLPYFDASHFALDENADAIAEAIIETFSLAKLRYQELLTIWKTADPDRPELAKAREFLGERHQ
jgi:hypothetical protein